MPNSQVVSSGIRAMQEAIQHYGTIKIFPDMFREVLLDKVGSSYRLGIQLSLLTRQCGLPAACSAGSLFCGVLLVIFYCLGIQLSLLSRQCGLPTACSSGSLFHEVLLDKVGTYYCQGEE